MINAHEAIPKRRQGAARQKLAVLISGRGSNLAALADAISSGSVPHVKIKIVISDQVNAAGVELARERGLTTAVIQRRGRSREEHEAEILHELDRYEIDLICLAGFMRLLSPGFVARYRGRILNIHPSLLPAFPGLDAQKQALEHGVKWTGCTVHLVDDTLDGGPIIAQRVIPVRDEDTEETLAARLLQEEHKLYAEAVALIASRDYRVVGRRVLRKN